MYLPHCASCGVFINIIITIIISRELIMNGAVLEFSGLSVESD